MAGTATITHAFPEQSSFLDRKMRRPQSRFSKIFFLLAITAGVGYIAIEIARDMERAPVRGVWPVVLLGLALLIALGFEFVNGFHDTANAVATVIYTHSLAERRSPRFATTTACSTNRRGSSPTG